MLIASILFRVHEKRVVSFVIILAGGLSRGRLAGARASRNGRTKGNGWNGSSRDARFVLSRFSCFRDVRSTAKQRCEIKSKGVGRGRGEGKESPQSVRQCDETRERFQKFQKFLSKSFLFEFIPHRTKFPASRSEPRKKKKKRKEKNAITRANFAAGDSIGGETTGAREHPRTSSRN